MIVSGKNYRGIFYWNENHEYEVGDLVISVGLTGPYLYKVINRVKGIDPGNVDQNLSNESIRKYFVPYSDDADNSLTLNGMRDILSRAFTGLDSEGVWTGGIIDKTHYTLGRTMNGSDGEVIEVLPNTNVLDEIIKNPRCNHGYFSFQKNNVYAPGTIFPMGDSGNGIIGIVQNTYKTPGDSSKKIRIQEVIDYENGIVSYRTYKDGSIGTWTTITAGSKSKDLVNGIVNQYYNSLNHLESKYRALQERYQWRKLPITLTATKKTQEDTNRTYSLLMTEREDLTIVLTNEHRTESINFSSKSDVITQDVLSSSKRKVMIQRKQGSVTVATRNCELSSAWSLSKFFDEREGINYVTVKDVVRNGSVLGGNQPTTLKYNINSTNHTLIQVDLQVRDEEIADKVNTVKEYFLLGPEEMGNIINTANVGNQAEYRISRGRGYSGGFVLKFSVTPQHQSMSLSLVELGPDLIPSGCRIASIKELNGLL